MAKHTATKGKKGKKSKPVPREVSDELDAIRAVVLGLLEEHLDASGESAGAFSSRAGIAPTTTSDLRVGRRAIGIETLLPIRTALGQDLGDVEMAAKQWERGIKPASACFGGDGSAALKKAASLVTPKEAKS